MMKILTERSTLTLPTIRTGKSNQRPWMKMVYMGRKGPEILPGKHRLNFTALHQGGTMTMKASVNQRTNQERSCGFKRVKSRTIPRCTLHTQTHQRVRRLVPDVNTGICQTSRQCTAPAKSHYDTDQAADSWDVAPTSILHIR